MIPRALLGIPTFISYAVAKVLFALWGSVIVLLVHKN